MSFCLFSRLTGEQLFTTLIKTGLGLTDFKVHLDTLIFDPSSSLAYILTRTQSKSSRVAFPIPGHERILAVDMKAKRVSKGVKLQGNFTLGHTKRYFYFDNCVKIVSLQLEKFTMHAQKGDIRVIVTK